MTLKLKTFLAPCAEVELANGKIYLYPVRSKDLSTLEALITSDPLSCVREFLPNIASEICVSKKDDQRVPLALERVQQVSDNDLQEVAEKYLQSSDVKLSLSNERAQQEFCPRETNESAVEYLHRWFNHIVNEQRRSIERVRRDALGFTQGVFDQVRKSSAQLGESIRTFDQFNTPELMPSVNTSLLQATSEYRLEAERNRAEELRASKLIGDMTAQSAKLLQNLADSATTFLERFNQRSEESERATHFQLWIAIASLAFSLVLSAFSLYYSIAAYDQDHQNNIAGDKWQVEVLAIIKEDSDKLKLIDQEFQTIRLDINAIKNRNLDQSLAPQSANSPLWQLGAGNIPQ